jgi:hypothetical protein
LYVYVICVFYWWNCCGQTGVFFFWKKSSI